MTERDAAAGPLALEREANQMRERLLGTLGELDHRRHAVRDHPSELVRRKLVVYRRPIAMAVGAVVLGLASVLSWSVYRLATREPRRREERWAALRRIWKHPERVARNSVPEGTLALQVGRKVLLSAIGWIAVDLTKKALSAVQPLVRPGAYGEPSFPRVLVRTLPA